MFRPPALRALTLVVTGVFALGAAPAVAGVEHIKQGSSSTKREEKRLVDSGQTEEVRGAKQLLGTTPHVDAKILGSTSKRVTESEIRSYQVPVTTHPVLREEKREVTTTTTNYIRRTTTEVIDRQWTVRTIGGYLREGYQFGAVLTQKNPSPNGDYRSMSRDYTVPGPQEYTPERYDWATAISMDISPHGMWGYLDAQLVFYKSSRAFMGGNIKCHDRWYANVKEASIIPYSDHDAIQYRLNCHLNEDPWPWTWCETDRTVWTVHLDRKLFTTERKKESHIETTDVPYTSVSTSNSAWTDTGRRELGAALTNPGLRYDPLSEKVMMRQVTVPNDVVAAKGLARSGNDVRRTFTADSSSGKSQASLSGSKVRQALGANQVKPSRVAGSKGGGAPDKSEGAPGLPGLLPDKNAEAPRLPNLPPVAAATPAPASTPAAAPASGAMGGTLPIWTVYEFYLLLFPWLQPYLQPYLQPTPWATPTPLPVTWWFPYDPQTPPPIVRYETYMSGQ